MCVCAHTANKKYTTVQYLIAPLPCASRTRVLWRALVCRPYQPRPRAPNYLLFVAPGTAKSSHLFTLRNTLRGPNAVAHSQLAQPTATSNKNNRTEAQHTHTHNSRQHTQKNERLYQTPAKPDTIYFRFEKTLWLLRVHTPIYTKWNAYTHPPSRWTINKK